MLGCLIAAPAQMLVIRVYREVQSGSIEKNCFVRYLFEAPVSTHVNNSKCFVAGKSIDGAAGPL